MDFILMSELEFVFNSLDRYLQTNDITFLESAQSIIKKAQAIDFAIKTLPELDYAKETGTDVFLENTHGIGRMLMFLINYYGELYCNSAILTIYNDDPPYSKFLHINTYKLCLRNPSTHDRLFATNARAEDLPYDFDTCFQRQITIATNIDGSIKETLTTATAYDSMPWLASANKNADGTINYVFEKPDYRIPRRTLDFKSAFWKSGHKHSVNYIMQLTNDNNFKVFSTNIGNSNEKVIAFEPLPENKIYYNLYYFWVNKFSKFENLRWDQFILT